MEQKTVVITRVSRKEENGHDSHLDFRSGVNVIVGPHNAGKTKWLETIDYLLGDDLSTAERMEDDIFVKYTSASASLLVAGEEMVVERRWKQYGEMNKVIVNEHPMSLDDYRALLLQKLSIPAVHYPQGNPFAPRAWPELGWRSLMRHVYRRQKSWTDLASKQPPVEQHACLLQFLGVAEKVFSTDYGDLITNQRRIQELKSNREHFIEMLQEVSREVIDSAELGVAISPSSLDAAVTRLSTERETLETRRVNILEDLAKPQTDGADQTQSDLITAMSNELVETRRVHEIASIALQRAKDRLAEVEDYRKVLSQELDRMECAPLTSKSRTAQRVIKRFILNLALTGIATCASNLPPRLVYRVLPARECISRLNN
jgi:DNA repair ATPase RecN